MGKLLQSTRKTEGISICLPVLVQQDFAEVANDCEMSYTEIL